MAVDLEHFLADQLARLPEDHPDRPFLVGQQAVVHAFVERTDPALIADGVEAVTPDAQAPTVLYEGRPVALTTPDPVPASAEQREQERLTLRGRLGARPRFSDTPRGVRRAEFNLAVHDGDEEAVTWHRVLAFRTRAEKLEQANPEKGQYLEVIGYQHREDYTGRDGQPKTREYLVAANVRVR